MTPFVTLRRAYETAVASSDLSEANFLERAREHAMRGALRVTGLPCAVEMDSTTLCHEFFGLLPSARREISSLEWCDLRLSFAWDGCAFSGNIDTVSEFRMIASRPGNFTASMWTDLRVIAADVEKLWPYATSLDEVLIVAANRSGGQLTQIAAEKIARESGVFSNRQEVLGALQRLGIAGKQGRKRKTP